MKNPDAFEKITWVSLPYDMQDEDPSKNYGIHGLDAAFILKGVKGSVQYTVNFPVYLPHVTASPGKIYRLDVGCHSPNPLYAGHDVMPCELLPGGKCYHDGSSLLADEWTEEIFSIRGERPENILYEKLERFYYKIFGEDNEAAEDGKS